MKLSKYFYNKSCMMIALSFATENKNDCIYHLLNYHFYKDEAQKYYFAMTHKERETLHKLMIL